MLLNVLDVGHLQITNLGDDVMKYFHNVAKFINYS